MMILVERTIQSFVCQIRTREVKAMKTLTAILFALALCVGGSDGPYFPWINLASLVPFAVCCIMVAGKERG
jgi:ABC-type transport system involved in cytochrome c biogenesis permease subunit